MSLPNGLSLSSNKDFIFLVFKGEVKKAFERKDKTSEEMMNEIDKFMKDSNSSN